jgi:hypothetical protein
MMRSRPAMTVAGIAIAGLFARGAQAQVVPDSARLMHTIGVLAHDSMEGRATGTAGSVKAQKFLVEELRRRGVKPWSRQSYTQSFRVPPSRQATNRDSVDATNIAGVIRGTKYPATYIAVSAHYDHLGVRNNDVFNGADDNASGTAGILEVASWFAAHPPQHSILILAFDAEERGDVGSRAFLRINKGLADCSMRQAPHRTPSFFPTSKLLRAAPR